MPTIHLKPIRASININAGRESDTELPQSLTYKVQLSREIWQSVSLTSGEALKDLGGHVLLYRKEPPESFGKAADSKSNLNYEPTNVIGQLGYREADEGDYHSEPAHYTAEVYLQPERFDKLSELARLGKIPGEISIEVVGEGVEYGGAPDGRDKIWDSKKKPYLPIVAAHFFVALATSPEGVEVELGSPEQSLHDVPPTRAQFLQLLQLVSRLPYKILLVGALLVAVNIFFSR